MQTFSFTGKLEKIDLQLVHYILVVPQEIIEQLPKGRVRVKGEMNGTPFALAIQSMKTGERYFSMGGALRREVKVKKAGEVIKVTFHLVDSEELDIPEELEAVLAQDPEGAEVFNALTTGYKRGLIHYITSVKNVDSRIKRAIQLIEKAKHGQLHAQKEKEEK